MIDIIRCIRVVNNTFEKCRQYQSAIANAWKAPMSHRPPCGTVVELGYILLERSLMASWSTACHGSI